MRQETNHLVAEAVARVNAFGDTNVYFKEAFMQNGEVDGIGADWHPTERTQKKFAEYLVEFIVGKKLI